MKTDFVLCPSCNHSYPNNIAFCPEDGTVLNNAPRNQAIGAGIKIGEYTVEKKLGEGGMGEVWSARQPQINKVVAIKLLSQKLTTNSQAMARFVQEARAVNEIGHRNIVDIFSFGELPDGRPYFVMEFLKGKSLSDYLQEKGPLPLSEVLPIMEQVCSALQAGHDAKIIHRDLKPDNLFMVAGTRTGRGEPQLFVKILDFGIAKLSAQEGESLTGTGALMGTPAYMSPEQCEGAKAADAASDIYALGVILFELLTGRTPFREPGDGVGVILSRQMFMPAPAPSTVVTGRSIPAALDAMVLRALAKNPKERFASCMDFYDALAKAAGTLSGETFEAIKGAAPVYHGQQASAEPLSKVVSEELAKRTPTLDAKNVSASRTGDFYVGAKEIEPPKPSGPPKKSLGKFIVAGVGAAVVALAVLLGFSSSSNQGPTPSNQTAKPQAEKPKDPGIKVVPPPEAPTTAPAPASVPTNPGPTNSPPPPLSSVAGKDTTANKTQKTNAKETKIPETKTLATQPLTETKPPAETKPESDPWDEIMKDQ